MFPFLSSIMIWFSILFLWACTRDDLPKAQQQPAYPNVLLISLESIRADRIGAYGDALANTPHMDHLSHHSILYRQAHTVSVDTVVAHAALMTGQYPFQNGLRDGLRDTLSQESMTLANALQTVGYRTAAFISSSELDGRGLTIGFDVVNSQTSKEEPPTDAVKQAIAWWKNQDGHRMAWVQLNGAELPLVDSSQGDVYRQSISAVDGLVGALISAVGSDTLIVLLSTNGESLWQMGERGHGVLLHPGITRIPWLLHPPNGLPGKQSPLSYSNSLPFQRPNGVDKGLILDPVDNAPTAALVVNETVSLTDVAPTIADYVGIDWKGTGTSKKPPIKEIETFAYAENLTVSKQFGWPAIFMLQQGEYRIEQGFGFRSYLWRDLRQTTPHMSLLNLLESLSGGASALTDKTIQPSASALQALSLSDILPPIESISVLSAHLNAVEGPQLSLKLARNEMKLKRYHQALLRAESVFKAFPQNHEASLLMAEAAFEQGLLSKAQEYADIAIGLKSSEKAQKLKGLIAHQRHLNADK